MKKYILLYVATIISVVFMLCSCATKSHVECVDREVVKYEKQYIHDTLYQHTHDSVYHTVYQRGDTVFDTKYVEKTKWRDRVVIQKDTCWRDSVQTMFKEVVKEKRIIPKWCYYSLAICVFFIIFAVVKLIIWIKTHGYVRT